MSLVEDNRKKESNVNVEDILANFFLKKINMKSSKSESETKHKKKQKHKKHKSKKHKHKSGRRSSSERRNSNSLDMGHTSSSEEKDIKRLKKLKKMDVKDPNKFNSFLPLSISTSSVCPSNENFVQNNTNVSIETNIPYGPSLELLLSGTEISNRDIESEKQNVLSSSQSNESSIHQLDLKYACGYTDNKISTESVFTSKESGNSMLKACSTEIIEDKEKHNVDTFISSNELFNTSKQLVDKSEKKESDIDSAVVKEESDDKKEKSCQEKSRSRSRSQSKPHKANTFSRSRSKSRVSQSRSRKRSLSRSRSKSRVSQSRSRKRSLSRSRSKSRLSQSRSRRWSLSRSRSKSRVSQSTSRKRSLSRSRSKSRVSQSRSRKRSLSRSRSKSRVSQSRSRKRSLSRSRSKSRISQSRSRKRSLSRSRSKSRYHKERSHSRNNSKSRHSSQSKRSRSKKRSRKSRSRSHSNRRHRRSRSWSYSKSKHDAKRRSRSISRRHRSRSHSKEYSRHRSRKDSDYADRSKRKTKSSSETELKLKQRSRSTSKEKYRSKIDQAKIREIAEKNVLNMIQQGTLPEGISLEHFKKKELVSIKAGGKSVQELTDFCAKLSKKENEVNDDTHDINSVGNLEGEHDFIHHPFKLKEQSVIKMNIKNAVQIPIKSHAEKFAETAKLSSQFPVSSGNQHKQKELEWIPVVPGESKSDRKANAEKSVPPVESATPVVKPAAPKPVKNVAPPPESCDIPSIPLPSTPLPPPPLPPLPSSAPPLPSPPLPPFQLLSANATPVQSTDVHVPCTSSTTSQAVSYPTLPFSGNSPVPTSSSSPTSSTEVGGSFFNKQPVSTSTTPIDFPSLFSKKFQAKQKLQEDPNNVEALKAIQEAEAALQEWVNSCRVPGMFYGSTHVKPLPREQLGGFKDYRVKKDTFTRAAPVTEGKGMSLLKKMGWNPGEGLGKNKEGALVPLIIDIKMDKKGLVSEGESGKNITNAAKELQGKHPVSALMELCSKRKWKPPMYNVIKDTGPPHKKQFLFKVEVNGVDYQPVMPSSNKKVAKADAAIVCLQSLKVFPS